MKVLGLEICHPKSPTGRTTSPHLKVCTVLGALKDEQGGTATLRIAMCSFFRFHGCLWCIRYEKQKYNTIR